ncbi:DNA polymerase IV 2 [Hyphomicrobiales bacterium]|jgi:DNA polymerase-4|nr:DNA polymerase IV 2 [Hyphomicrobiales bacterium]CAH1702840.1 DNA polymerase IV 2 [Hyphomicrobiales bacterium]CAI0347028.1 DNA polymerase IV 2 [Hyphomicrobiales bacterium]
MRRIVHIDQDAFYASCEIRDHAELRGKPVVVGSDGRRGVIAAASYEARAFGIRSAMPGFKAKALCPDVIFMPPRFEVYRAVSAQIRAIFAEYTDLIEPLSLDEAYLDVTENKRGIEFASVVAREIRERILKETELTASAGISYQKFLAKMASSQRKPNGQFVITPEDGPEFVANLKIEKFHGVGPSTAAAMKNLGIHTGRDLREKPIELLIRHFGKSGPYFYALARGIDDRPVVPDRVRKSVGAENTMLEDTSDRDELIVELAPLIDKVWSHCARNGTRGKTVVLKVTYSDFEQITRSRSNSRYIEDRAGVELLAHELLNGLFPLPKPIRLVGVTLTGLNTEEAGDTAQLALAL